MKTLSLLLLSALGALSLSSCKSTTPSGGSPEAHQYRSRGSTTVSAASTDGRFVILSDGSIWNINWDDARDVSRWRSGEAVSISRSGSSNFPYVLNNERGSSVSARLGKKLD